MITTPSDPWSKYKVSGKPHSATRFNSAFLPLTDVYHIAHVGDALRIIDDRKIRSSLVWDESCLNDTRACVSWVSANTWADGSIYGNIRFSFGWKDLINRKDFYWVEDVPSYRPPAFRILITNNPEKYSTLKIYPYDRKEGPIYFDGTNWWRNGNYTSEFLIDNDLSLSKCKGIDFDKHHSNLCNKQSNCDDKGLRQEIASSIFLANIIGRGNKEVGELLANVDSDKPWEYKGLKYGLDHLAEYLISNVQFNDAGLPAKKNKFLIKASMLALGNRQTNLSRALLEIMSEESYYHSLNGVVSDYFGFEIDCKPSF